MGDVGAGGAGGQPLGWGNGGGIRGKNCFLARMDLDKIVCMYEICNNESCYSCEGPMGRRGPALCRSGFSAVGCGVGVECDDAAEFQE